MFSASEAGAAGAAPAAAPAPAAPLDLLGGELGPSMNSDLLGTGTTGDAAMPVPDGILRGTVVSSELRGTISEPAHWNSDEIRETQFVQDASERSTAEVPCC